MAQVLRRSLTQRDSDGDEASVARTDARKAARLQGYEGLIAAQECLPKNDARDAFAAEFSVLARIWEAVSPDPVLTQYEKDYRCLVQVYNSLKPSTGTGRLLWHRLGAKTIELIHENVHVEAVRDDLDTLVLDADLLKAVMGTPDPDKSRQRDHDQADRPTAQTCGQSAVQGAGGTPGGSEEPTSTGPIGQHRFPEGVARTCEGRGQA